MSGTASELAIPPGQTDSSKWIRTVVDLIAMTNQQKLVWHTGTSPSPYYGTQYQATLGQTQFTLSLLVTPSDMREAIALNYALPAGINRYPLLTMVTSPSASPITFPDIAPVGALAQAVQRQAQPEDVDAVLDHIHDIAMSTTVGTKPSMTIAITRADDAEKADNAGPT